MHKVSSSIPDSAWIRTHYDLGTMTNPNLSTTGPVTRQQDASLQDPSLMYATNFDQGAFISEAGFSEVFDSLNWVFEGIPDSFVAPPVM